MEPPTTQAPTPPPPPSSQTPNTYHCLCTHLLLATTHDLSSLPRRKAPGLDSAIILPLPPPPTTSISSPTSSQHAPPSPSRSRSRSLSASSSSSSPSPSSPNATTNANANANDPDPDPPSAVEQQQQSTHQPSHALQPARRLAKHRDAEGNRGRGYSILLSATLDRKAVVVRREDGFEKRYLWRCGRCRLVVGYQVDEVHFRGREAEGGGVRGGGASGRRAEVLYLLPGGLLSTEEMKVGGRAVGDEGWV